MFHAFLILCFDILILDIDECARNISGCNQNCTNSNGSYFCSCYPGYEIENDNKTCIGKGFDPMSACSNLEMQSHIMYVSSL